MKVRCDWLYCPGRSDTKAHLMCRWRRWWGKTNWLRPERWLR